MPMSQSFLIKTNFCHAGSDGTDMIYLKDDGRWTASKMSQQSQKKKKRKSTPSNTQLKLGGGKNTPLAFLTKSVNKSEIKSLPQRANFVERGANFTVQGAGNANDKEPGSILQPPRHRPTQTDRKLPITAARWSGGWCVPEVSGGGSCVLI